MSECKESGDFYEEYKRCVEKTHSHMEAPNHSNKHFRSWRDAAQRKMRAGT